MAVSLTLSQARTIEGAGVYKVVSTASAGVGIPTEVFVYKYSGEYDHVATPFDIKTYPATPTSGQAFYRTSVGTQTFTDVATAKAAADHHKVLVERLVTDYAASVVGFSGSDSNVYSVP